MTLQIRLFLFKQCIRLSFLLYELVLLAYLRTPNTMRKFKINAHKFDSFLKLRLLQEGTDSFASEDVVESKRPLKCNSDRSTFWHELILEPLGNQPSFIVSWWDTLVLKELHLLHNLDRLLQLLAPTLLDWHIGQSFNCSFKIFLVLKLMIDLLTQNIAGHKIDA